MKAKYPITFTRIAGHLGGSDDKNTTGKPEVYEGARKP